MHVLSLYSTSIDKLTFTTAGIRLTACSVSDINIANALTHRNDIVQIYSNSWGPIDDGRTVDGPGLMLQVVLQNAVKQVNVYT